MFTANYCSGVAELKLKTGLDKAVTGGVQHNLQTKFIPYLIGSFQRKIE